MGLGLGIGIRLGTGIADLNLTYLRLLSTKTYHISYGGPEPALNDVYVWCYALIVVHVRNE